MTGNLPSASRTERHAWRYCTHENRLWNHRITPYIYICKYKHTFIFCNAGSDLSLPVRSRPWANDILTYFFLWAGMICNGERVLNVEFIKWSQLLKLSTQTNYLLGLTLQLWLNVLSLNDSEWVYNKKKKKSHF